MSHVFTGTIENGHLDQNTREKIAKALQKYTRVVITLEERKTTRTIPQNKYLFGVVYPIIAEYTEHTTEEIHAIMKRKFLPFRYILYRDIAVKTIGTTKNLTKEEFSDFIERVKVEAAELGLIIPTLEEAGYISNT